MPNAAIRFRGGKLLRKGSLVEEDLWIQGPQIIEPAEHCDDEVDVQGLIIAPGYIDLQINGGYGRDFSTDSDALETICSALPRHGVTSFLPTIISSTPEEYQRLLPPLMQQMEKPPKGAIPLGLHLEGPFLHPDFAGAHPKEKLTSVHNSYGSLDWVRMITLAPELKQAHDYILMLKEKGIVASAGHTGATYHEAKQAIEAGIYAVTHLFNGMAPFHHREPGLIGAALTHPGLAFSLILDGIHVHPAAVNMAWRANPEGLFLVSDAMAALGLDDGTYRLGSRTVTVKGNIVTLRGTHTLAGSVLGLDQAVRNLRAWTGCSIAEALEAASLKPAKLLGLTQKGRLDIGADADLVILDRDLFVQSTYSGGELLTN
ncbi:MAG: N-acetylglucosamine-6-phosphate deacetylase [Parachlamydia sp.]|nr:N-acetylglucosamine-6-phosphate deacetylase [Parachlamydia sp.]